MNLSSLAFGALLAVASASPVVLESRQSADFKDEMLASHNFFRGQHGADPIVWDDGLAQKSQRWADRCNFSHESAGENLAYRSHYNFWGEFTNMWGSERTQYNFGNPGFSPATGHFTQVVWKATTNMGCAWKNCRGGINGYFVVCKYSPPGNYQGQFAQNVGRQTKGSPDDVFQP